MSMPARLFFPEKLTMNTIGSLKGRKKARRGHDLNGD
jgi:hypothetical protein